MADHADNQDSRTATVGRKRALDAAGDGEQQQRGSPPQVYEELSNKRMRLSGQGKSGVEWRDYDDEPDTLVDASKALKETDRPMNVESMPVNDEAKAVQLEPSAAAREATTQEKQIEDTGMGGESSKAASGRSKQGGVVTRNYLQAPITTKRLSVDQVLALQTHEKLRAASMYKPLGKNLVEIHEAFEKGNVILIAGTEHPSKNEHILLAKHHVGTARNLVMKIAAQSASNGLISFCGDIRPKEARYSIIFIYSAPDLAERALAHFKNGTTGAGSVKAAMLPNMKRLGKRSFTTFRSHMVETYSKYRTPVLQEALESGVLSPVAYGGFRDPPVVLVESLPDNEYSPRPASGIRASSEGSDNSDSESMSEGEISEDEEVDSSMMTNIEGNPTTNQDQAHSLEASAPVPVPAPEVEYGMQQNDSRIPGEGPGSRPTDDLRIDDLNDEDRDLQELYYPPRASSSLVRCFSCNLSGHLDFQCPSLTCTHCSSSGDHFSHHCAKRPSSARPGTRNATECSICNASTHTNDHCGWLWRTFNPDAQPNLKKIEHMNVSCYSCGSSEHWGGDCPFAMGPPSLLGSSFCAEEANKYLQQPMSVPVPHFPPPPPGHNASAPRIPNARAPHALPPRPLGAQGSSRGIAIKGTAPMGQHTTFDDEGLEVRGSGNRNANRGRGGGMQMNINGSNPAQGRNGSGAGRNGNAGGSNANGKRRGEDHRPAPAPPPPLQMSNGSGSSRGGGGGGGGRGRGSRAARYRGRGGRGRGK